VDEMLQADRDMNATRWAEQPIKRMVTSASALRRDSSAQLLASAWPGALRTTNIITHVC
jgi:hypothetical protein